MNVTVATPSLHVLTSRCFALKHWMNSLRFSSFFWETKMSPALFFFRFLLKENLLKKAYAKSLNEVIDPRIEFLNTPLSLSVKLSGMLGTKEDQ